MAGHHQVKWPPDIEFPKYCAIYNTMPAAEYGYE